MYYIYLITNTINGKIYVGQTDNLEERWHAHKTTGKRAGSNMVITRAMYKYGVNNFVFDEIANCRTRDDADEVEASCILQYNALDKSIGYNVKAGGATSKMTEEIRRKVSESSMGKPGTNKGKKFDDEWVVNISKSLAGKPQVSRRRFSDEIEKEICRMYVEEEKSLGILGKEYKCGKGLIRNILIRDNVVRRKTNYGNIDNKQNIFSLEQELEICKIYSNSNISRSKLTKQFKCGKTTIRDILLRHNAKL